jgi:hypothetical protein
MVGTWVNPAYNDDGSTDTPGKVVIGSDNTLETYETTTSTTPAITGTITVEDDWVDGDYHYFKGVLTTTNTNPTETIHVLMRISNEGYTYEANSTTTGTYPTAIDPTASDYQYYTRDGG